MTLSPEQAEAIDEDQRRVNRAQLLKSAEELGPEISKALSERRQSLAKLDTTPEPKRANGHASGEWLSPSPLPDGLPAVEAFELEIVPPILRRAIQDIAERMQCPPDFPAVALVVELSSVIGRRCGIMPRRSDDWTVIPNLWGMVIGRPGIMKSPPLQEVMRPLNALEKTARESFDRDMLEFQASKMLSEQSEKIAKDAVKAELKRGNRAEAMERALGAIKTSTDGPICRRYIVNDCTVEKLGEILNENPQGVLLFRDELAGFFRTLERQGHEADRAFYLEAWNGDGSFTYDRIGRGTIHISAACLSVIGSIQPGPLSDLVRGLRGSGDDGLLQRFQLAVWPDVSPHWRNIDRLPDRNARDEIAALIARLDSLPVDPTVPMPALRFESKAQDLFDAWRERLEKRLRTDGVHPMLEAHIAKYRSLVPSLSLILHLAENAGGPVELISLERAIAWASYLESHALRIYAPAISPDMDSARALALHIQSGDVQEAFALRDIYRCGWTSLSGPDEAAAAVRVLEEFDWLRSHQEQTPGRSRTYYQLNPAVMPIGGKA